MEPLEIYLITTIAGLVADGIFGKWERFKKYKGLFSWATDIGKFVLRMK